MASLRSQGYTPHMVKIDGGATVYAFTQAEVMQIDDQFSLFYNLFRACSWEEFHALPQFMQNAFPPDPDDPESAALRYKAVTAALHLLNSKPGIQIPDVREAGFAPRVKRNFWGAIIPAIALFCCVASADAATCEPRAEKCPACTTCSTCKTCKGGVHCSACRTPANLIFRVLKSLLK